MCTDVTLEFAVACVACVLQTWLGWQMNEERTGTHTYSKAGGRQTSDNT